MPPVQPPGYCDIPGKPHGTVKTVPYKPTEKAIHNTKCVAV